MNIFLFFLLKKVEVDCVFDCGGGVKRSVLFTVEIDHGNNKSQSI